MPDGTSRSLVSVSQLHLSFEQVYLLTGWNQLVQRVLSYYILWFANQVYVLWHSIYYHILASSLWLRNDWAIRSGPYFKIYCMNEIFHNHNGDINVVISLPQVLLTVLSGEIISISYIDKIPDVSFHLILSSDCHGGHSFTKIIRVYQNM